MSSTPVRDAGYRRFQLAGFEFRRDEYFVHIEWHAQRRSLSHSLPADVFLRAMMRCVAWNFFYGSVFFDDVFGTRNLYGRVELFAGLHHPAFAPGGLHHVGVVEHAEALATCRAMLLDWTNETFDPFAAPAEAGLAWIGPKRGSHRAAIDRGREACRRMLGLPGDLPPRSDATGSAVNRAFADVPQDVPEVHAEPGFESELHAVNLFAHVSRADTTWNPSVSSVCGDSLFCTTAEEYLMPVGHANDRIEWFVQLSDEIVWEIDDRETGLARAKLVMKAGDVAAMPANVRHRGLSPKRSMLLVWENADPALPVLYESGALPPSPAALIRG